MDPKRWGEIERLYHLAREREPGEREKFLAEACGGDEHLRQEIESLLARPPKAQDFLDPKTRKWSILMGDAADAWYAPTGHLVFLRRGALMVVPFDLDRLQVIGQPVPAIPNVMQALNMQMS